MNSAFAENSTIVGYFVTECPGRGKGVYSSKIFSTGDFVMLFKGNIVDYQSISDFTHYIQIGPMEFLSPSGEADDFVNHCCDPNCALYFENGKMVMRTIRSIEAGEELTLDYGTILFTEPTSFTCGCESHKCRGLVGSYFLLPQHIKERYHTENMVPLLSLYTLDQLLKITSDNIVYFSNN